MISLDCIRPTFLAALNILINLTIVSFLEALEFFREFTFYRYVASEFIIYDILRRFRKGLIFIRSLYLKNYFNLNSILKLSHFFLG